MDQTDRNTSALTVQDEDENSSEQDTQLASGSNLNVVDNTGPIQIGTGSTVINKQTYNIDNSQHHHHHHHYHPSPYHPAYHNDYLPQLLLCPVHQSRDNDQLEDQTSRSEDITNRNTSAQSQTERKTFHHAAQKSSYHYQDYLRWVEQTAAALGSGPSHPGLPPCSLPERPSGDHLQDQHLRNEDTTERKTFHHHHRDRSSSFHVPCHCWDYLHYHRNDHQPLAENPRPQQPRHSQLLHHAVPQLLPSPQHTELTERKETSASGRDPQCRVPEARSPVPSAVPSGIRHHVTTAVKSKKKPKDNSNEKETRPKQHIEGQRSSKSPRSPAGDVTHNVTREEPGERKDTVTTKTADRENVKSKNTSTGSKQSTLSGCVIIDTAGQVLEPGDALWSDISWNRIWAIYVGDQKIVMEGSDLVVKMDTLKLVAPFGKLSVKRGWCRVYPPRQRVDRATSWIGRKFEEGEGMGQDFCTFVFTGLGYNEAHVKGFAFV